MNLAHVHLLLNHFPTIGFGIGLALYFAALIGKKDDLHRASLVIFFLIAAVAIPTYMSGNAAEEIKSHGRPPDCGWLRVCGGR